MVNHQEYPDGIVKLYSQLCECEQKAFEIASRCVQGLTRSRDIKLAVNFSWVHQDNAFRGEFIFNGIIFSFLSVNIDYALLLCANPGKCKSDANLRDISSLHLSNLIRTRVPPPYVPDNVHDSAWINFIKNSVQSYCLTVVCEGAENIDCKRIPNVTITPIHDESIRDELDSPIRGNIKRIKKVGRAPDLRLLTDTKFLSSNSTKKRQKCLIMADRAYGGQGIIWVYKWFPITRAEKMKSQASPNAWGETFFPMGTLNMDSNAAMWSLVESTMNEDVVVWHSAEDLFNYMMENNCQILFGEIEGCFVNITDDIGIFMKEDIYFPKCFSEIEII